MLRDYSSHSAFKNNKGEILKSRALYACVKSLFLLSSCTYAYRTITHIAKNCPIAKLALKIIT